MNGSVQLRLEGIDAPELHYGTTSQPRGATARDALLTWLGVRDLVQETLAVLGERELDQRVVAGARRRALAQELEPPRVEREIGLETHADGGLLTEQRPRRQSRAEVVPLAQGDAVLFAVHHRPVTGARGTYRVNLRHGVSRLHRGSRQTLGVIFHDAR